MYRLIKWALYCATVVIIAVIISKFSDDYLRCMAYVVITVLLSAVVHKWLAMYEPMPQVFRQIIHIGEKENDDKTKD